MNITDIIQTVVINDLNSKLCGELNDNQITSILNEAISRAYEKVEEKDQKALYRQLSLELHPDKIRSSAHHFAKYLVKPEQITIPQKILNRVKESITENIFNININFDEHSLVKFTRKFIQFIQTIFNKQNEYPIFIRSSTKLATFLLCIPIYLLLLAPFALFSLITLYIVSRPAHFLVYLTNKVTSNGFNKVLEKFEEAFPEEYNLIRQQYITISKEGFDAIKNQLIIETGFILLRLTASVFQQAIKTSTNSKAFLLSIAAVVLIPVIAIAQALIVINNRVLFPLLLSFCVALAIAPFTPSMLLVAPLYAKDYIINLGQHMKQALQRVFAQDSEKSEVPTASEKERNQETPSVDKGPYQNEQHKHYSTNNFFQPGRDLEASNSNHHSIYDCD